MPQPTGRHHVDLSHVVRAGMETYPGLPLPIVETHLSREAAEQVYGPGVTFQIGVVTLCTNTGTYLDVPFHRFVDGHDLTELALERVAAVPAVRVDAGGRRRIDSGALAAAVPLREIAGHAVLVYTGHDRHFGTPQYTVNHPFLTMDAAGVLIDAGVACVGIDSLNIDDTNDATRPVHTTLLRAGIPIIEHLTNLGALPPEGFTFTAVPPKIEGAGTFTVRAYATVP